MDPTEDSPEEKENCMNAMATHKCERSCVAITLAVNILLLCGMVLLMILVMRPPAPPSLPPHDIHPSCAIFCSGSILHIIQTSNVFNDSKYFIDMPLKTSPETVIAEFSRLPNFNRETLKTFVANFFSPPGSDLRSVVPVDFQEEPQTLKSALKGSKYYDWALALNAIWATFVRIPEISDPARHTLIPTEHPIVVPGGRIREWFYWDSYWIIVGLIQSEMHVTAKGMVSNFLDVVREYGFLPNAGRAYFLTRTNPPFLAEMVYELYRAGAIDQTFLKHEALPALEQEYAFWQEKRSKAIRKGIVLNWYTGGDHSFPRPEMYSRDMTVSAKHRHQNEAQMDFIAAAESGWDFSSRWTGKSNGTQEGPNTRNIVPVDLNVLLLRYERFLKEWCHEVGDYEKAGTYGENAKLRENAIEQLMWSEEEGMWRDWMLEEGKMSEVVALSNFLPLWAGLGGTNKSKVATALKTSGLIGAGGLASSTEKTGERWDGDNAWAPMQDLIVEGLLNGGDEESKQVAIEIVKGWLESNFIAWQRDKTMWEIYSASQPGARGDGRDLPVQDGFGWSNGVALKMLVKFAEELQS